MTSTNSSKMLKRSNHVLLISLEAFSFVLLKMYELIVFGMKTKKCMKLVPSYPLVLEETDPKCLQCCRLSSKISLQWRWKQRLEGSIYMESEKGAEKFLPTLLWHVYRKFNKTAVGKSIPIYFFPTGRELVWYDSELPLVEGT